MAAPTNPPGTAKGKPEKAFVRDFLAGKLIAVTLVDETVVRGRLIFWDQYTVGLTPDDDGGLPMLVHKQLVATVQAMEA